MIFWLAALRKKKAGAKRPRVKTTVISIRQILSLNPAILNTIQIERGAMAVWINERDQDHATV
jgi:hypothetical protein